MGQFSTKYAESRADHGLENFGDSLYPYERYGRHVGTRTPDLYRVNFEVRKLKPFPHLAFPHSMYVERVENGLLLMAN
jgi:hypothetical protein